MKKKFLGNKYKKDMCYEENKSLFFEVIKNGQIFPSKVCHFQYDHRFLFSREMRNIRTRKEIRLYIIYNQVYNTTVYNI